MRSADTGHNVTRIVARASRDIVLAVVATSLLLVACSRHELPPVDTTTPAAPTATTNDAKEAKEQKAKQFQDAAKACKDQTERKGFGSVVGIFSRLRRGSAEEDYANCMKQRGFDV